VSRVVVPCPHTMSCTCTLLLLLLLFDLSQTAVPCRPRVLCMSVSSPALAATINTTTLLSQPPLNPPFPRQPTHLVLHRRV
jgi:hypothetical protein